MLGDAHEGHCRNGDRCVETPTLSGFAIGFCTAERAQRLKLCECSAQLQNDGVSPESPCPAGCMASSSAHPALLLFHAPLLQLHARQIEHPSPQLTDITHLNQQLWLPSQWWQSPPKEPQAQRGLKDVHLDEVTNPS